VHALVKEPISPPDRQPHASLFQRRALVTAQAMGVDAEALMKPAHHGASAFEDAWTQNANGRKILASLAIEGMRLNTRIGGLENSLEPIMLQREFKRMRLGSASKGRKEVGAIASSGKSLMPRRIWVLPVP
jgi:hypothetical protein